MLPGIGTVATIAMLLPITFGLPPVGALRLSLDWTTEGVQHLLIASVRVGGRAVPLYWRAYHSSELKKQMSRYEREFIRTLFPEVLAGVKEAVEKSVAKALLPLVRTAISNHRAFPSNTSAPKSSETVKNPLMTGVAGLVIGPPTCAPKASVSCIANRRS